MKFITAMTLGLMSLHAFALPVLTEVGPGEKRPSLFKDHKFDDVLHYLPTQHQLMIMDSKPAFDLLYRESKNDDPARGWLLAIFDYDFDYYDSIRNEHIANGIEVQEMKVRSFYMNFKDTAGMFKDLSFSDFDGKFHKGGVVTSFLTNKGIKELPDLLKKRPESMELFEACYEVKGVTPVMDATVTMRSNKVYEYFKTKVVNAKRLTKQEIKEGVNELINQSFINIQIMGGEASKADYAMAIAEGLILDLFSLDNGKTYSLIEQEVGNIDFTYYMSGREYVTRDLCVDLSLDYLKGHSDLIVDQRK